MKVFLGVWKGGGKITQPKLTISVTQALFEELDRVRDVINVSEVCRKALWSTIRTITRTKKGGL